MTEADLRPDRRLWSAVLHVALEDMRRRVARAQKGKTSIVIGNTRHEMLPLQGEIDAAHSYLRSADCRMVCDLAGVTMNIDRAMEFIRGERDDL